MAAKTVLVYGGSGALGQVCVTYLASRGWTVYSADFTRNSKAFGNVFLEKGQPVTDAQLREKFIDVPMVDMILNVAGGWAGGDCADKGFVGSCTVSWEQSVVSSVACAGLAGYKLSSGGLLILTGSAAALQPTPGMVGYGLAKAAVHHIVRSVGQREGANGLPPGAKCIGLLPATLDTPGNRAAMPGADPSTWTPLEEVAWNVNVWATDPTLCPPSGSLAVFKTRNRATQIHIEK